MAQRILTLRELNRATLARQFLLERTSQPALDVIKRLVALQGQVSNAPYIGLWTRLQAFERAELTTFLEERQVVRASSLRGTLHVLVVEGAEEMAPTAALRALRLHRTGIAPGRICAIDQHFFALATAVQR